MICYGLLIMLCEATAPAPPVIVCPAVPAWSKAYQLKLAGEIERMPADSATARAMREHVQLRDRARKCRRGR